MICGSHSVFFLSFLSFMLLGLFSEIITEEVECGKDVTITPDCKGDLTCDPTSEIITVNLKHVDFSKQAKTMLDISDVADTKRHCSNDGKFCLQLTDRKNMNLTIHNVTFGDQGIYTLYSERLDNIISSNIINLIVKGVCDPVLSSSQDKLTCNVRMEKTYKPEITWLDKNRKIHQSEKPLENKTEYVSEWHQYLMLTDETRRVQMCCSVRYEEKRLEKQKCTDEHLPSLEETDRQSQEMNTKKRVIPILIMVCLLLLAIAVAVYFNYRRRRPPPFPWPRRGDDQEENRETTSSVPLQKP